MPLHDVSSPGQPSGHELDYLASTSALTVTATTQATAQSYIDGNQIWLPGDIDIWIEFFSANVAATSGVAIQAIYDGATDLGLRYGQGSTASGIPWYSKKRVTAPSVGFHTYHIKFWTNSSGGTIVGGSIYESWYMVSVA